MKTAHKGYQFRLVFTDMLNQTVLGGHYYHFETAMAYAHTITAAGRKSSFKVIRLSDKVVLAQSY